MKSIIAEHYLQEAKRIRQSYFQHLAKINEKNEKIKQHREELENILKEMELLQKRAEEDTDFEQTLNGKLIEIEIQMNAIQDEIRPNYETIKNLRQESSNLYSAISEKYPDLTVDDIKIQIIDYININLDN
jgi:predicted  nucleic acid-binding Zn-ribbon protein